MGRACFGLTGGVSKIVDGQPTRVADGLPSMSTATDVIGPSDVSVGADGTLSFTVGGGGDVTKRGGLPPELGDNIGWLLEVDSAGTISKVADVLAFETANDPDAGAPGAAIDSDVNSVAALTAGYLVADAGGNDLLMVDADGKVSLVAVFPVSFQPAPPDPTQSPAPGASPQMIPMQAVPTSVAVGPDGAYYVGLLTGFPFPKGLASVMRVEPGEEPTVYATGFTNVMDVAFAPDGTLYVLEIAHDGLLSATSGPPAGGLWKVPAGGGTPELVTADGLVMPGGMAIDKDGAIYISTCAVCHPKGGSIVKLTP